MSLVLQSELLEHDRLFGLIGYPLSHSFSKRYFSEKYAREGISGAYYELFPIEAVSQLPALVAQYPNLRGLNVTIPYKEQVIPFLDEIDDGAAAVGAVNTIKVEDGKLSGYNTDVYGFEQSLLALFEKAGRRAERALILGTGGAAKAVAFVLERHGISYHYVSRRPGPDRWTYQELDAKNLQKVTLIINTTPLGMTPDIASCPDIPYHDLDGSHQLFDLIYNPEITTFMQRGLDRGATVQNGLQMLHLQAEQAWTIWNT
jgi:shikimate dehydrogenase